MDSVAGESDGLTLFYLNGEIAVSPSNQAAGWADRNGKHCIVETNLTDPRLAITHVTAHEIGHVIGAGHTPEGRDDFHHLMRATTGRANGDFEDQRRFTIEDHWNFKTGPELELITP